MYDSFVIDGLPFTWHLANVSKVGEKTLNSEQWSCKCTISGVALCGRH